MTTIVEMATEQQGISELIAPKLQLKWVTYAEMQKQYESIQGDRKTPLIVEDGLIVQPLGKAKEL